MRAVSAYIGRRLAIAIPLLWIVSVVSYLLLYRAADPVARLRRIPGVRPEDVARLVEQQGLDAPWYEGYWSWLSGFVRGDWGLSASNPGVGAREAVFFCGDAVSQKPPVPQLVHRPLSDVGDVTQGARQVVAGFL